MNKSEIVNILIDGRRLAADGWCQRTLVRDAGLFRSNKQYCTWGAICVAANVDMSLVSEDQLVPVVRILCEVLPEEYRPIFCAGTVSCLTSWNDGAKRKHSEVLDLFDRAIAKAMAIVEDEPKPQRGEPVVRLEDFGAVPVAAE